MALEQPALPVPAAEARRVPVDDSLAKRQEFVAVEIAFLMEQLVASLAHKDDVVGRVVVVVPVHVMAVQPISRPA